MSCGGPSCTATAASIPAISVSRTRPAPAARSGARGPGARPGRLLNRDEYGDLAPLKLEELAREQRAERPGLRQPACAERRREFAHRIVSPRHHVRHGDDLGDRQRGHRRDRAELDPRPRHGAVEQRPQPADRRLGLLELAFHPRQVGGDLPVPCRQVGCEQHGPDRVERHAQVAQPPDHLGGGYLVGAVGAVAGVRVDRRGRQDAHVVIVVQRLHAEVGRPGELADGQHRRRHGGSITAPRPGPRACPRSYPRRRPARRRRRPGRCPLPGGRAA